MDGGRVSIIAYKSGEYEIYLTPAGEEFPTSAVRLTLDEARALVAAFPHAPASGPPSPFPEFSCVVVPGDSPCLGKEAGELLSGAAFIMAVQPVAAEHLHPAAGHRLQVADILYLTGPRQDREELARKIRPHD